MVIADLYYWDVELRIIQAPNNWIALIVQSIPPNVLGRIKCASINLMEAQLILPKTFGGIWRHSSILNSLLWSGSDTIINTCDLMQNLNQTQIFYKLGRTCLTRMTQMIQMTQPGFIPDTTLRCICMNSYKFRQNASCSYAQFHYDQ